MDRESTTISPNAAFFEYIGFTSIFSILYHSLRSNTIFYLDIDPHLAKMAWVQGAVTRKKLIKVFWNETDSASRLATDREILDDVERYHLEKNIAGTGIVFLIASFFKSEKIANAYKKAHAMSLVNRYRLALVVQDTMEKYSIPGTVSVYPKDTASLLIHPHQKKFHDPTRGPRIVVPPAVRISARFRYLWLKVRNTGMLCALPFWIMVKVGVPSLHPLPKKEFMTAVRIYKTDFAFFQKYRSIDFLLDNVVLNSDNTIFCQEMEISADYKGNLERRHYKTADMRTILRHADLSFITKTILGKYFLLWLRSLPRTIFTQSDTVLTTLELLHSALIWERFCSIYSCRTYVAYNDTIAKHVVRNLIFERHGTKTVYYVFSCNTPDYFTPPGKEPFITVYYSYLNYDYVIAWNRKVAEYYLQHINTIGDIVITGCLWSEHVSDIRRKHLPNEVFSQVKEEIIRKNSSYPEHTVSVFDTTFGGMAPLKVNDILAFLQDIIRMLDEFPGLAVIFKMKNPWGYHLTLNPDIEDAYRALSDHSRCVVLNGFDIEPAEVIAASDLVISACFTSSTVEAWGADIPGIFYDATSLYRGYYYDGFPGFTLHNYMELRDSISRLLESGEKPSQLADKGESERRYVTGIDPFIDGRGISRFREFLKETSGTGK